MSRRIARRPFVRRPVAAGTPVWIEPLEVRRLFTFDLNADTPRLEAETIVHLLRRKLTHFVMTTPESPPPPEGEG